MLLQITLTEYDFPGDQMKTLSLICAQTHVAYISFSFKNLQAFLDALASLRPIMESD